MGVQEVLSEHESFDENHVERRLLYTSTFINHEDEVDRPELNFEEIDYTTLWLKK